MGAILRPDVKRLLTRPSERKEESAMVMFVDQDKMTPVQLALETARYEFANLHGCTIKCSGDYSYVFDSTE